MESRSRELSRVESLCETGRREHVPSIPIDSICLSKLHSSISNSCLGLSEAHLKDSILRNEDILFEDTLFVPAEDVFKMFRWPTAIL